MGTSRPSGGWATASDWANHRSLITALYRDQNKTLKQTMQVMEEKHSFFATVRMYKARFQQWEIEKKIKAEDAVEIFRQQSARTKAGKSSVVYIRGRKINPDRLQRYRYRAPPPVSEKIFMVERELSTSPSEFSTSSHIICRTPSPSPQLEDPADFKAPLQCMQILEGYIVSSVESRAWHVSNTAPVPDAFTWAHYLATSQGLVAHNRTREGFILLDICMEQYKSHLENPDPFFWLATYKAALLLGSNNMELGNLFIKYASSLTSIVLPPNHPFQSVWSRINITGLHGLQQCAAALFESYLNVWKEQAGMFPTDETGLVQMAFVFIQLRCGGVISDHFTREALDAIMALLSNPISGQFLLQEANFRLACLFLEQGKLDEADAVIGQILEWIDLPGKPDPNEFNHLRCKCLWTMFEINDRQENIEEATRVGHRLVHFCEITYGPSHLQTIDAISALQSFHTRNNNTKASKELAKQFHECWTDFFTVAREKNGFPHTIEQPWLHRCVELDEDENLIRQVVDLLKRSSLA
ncbi:hypothetical protein ANO14919_033690 [Xylariales sp. No.14919]|nr:hypothetical protein ANO14919_033690 [Xylariales sp. No.14919]